MDWKVDLTQHRSRQLTPAMVDLSDLIFVFDYANYFRMSEDFKIARKKLHFLGSLTPNGPLLIQDPIDSDSGKFTKVYAQIAYAIRSFNFSQNEKP